MAHLLNPPYFIFIPADVVLIGFGFVAPPGAVGILCQPGGPDGQILVRNHHLGTFTNGFRTIHFHYCGPSMGLPRSG